MNENMSISNAEMKVMNHIWKTGAMITVPEMLAILNEEGEEWTYPTVATFLRRLETKGILGVTKKGNKLCYFPLVSKEQYETKEAEGFVESKFGGSLKNFLVAFRGSDKISKKDMNDLKAWLDELDEGACVYCCNIVIYQRVCILCDFSAI